MERRGSSGDELSETGYADMDLRMEASDERRVSGKTSRGSSLIVSD